MTNELKVARAHCNEMYAKFGFKSAEYEAAFEAVRKITSSQTVTKEEFCSIDSGVHRTRLLDGRII